MIAPSILIRTRTLVHRLTLGENQTLSEVLLIQTRFRVIRAGDSSIKCISLVCRGALHLLHWANDISSNLPPPWRGDKVRVRGVVL